MHSKSTQSQSKIRRSISLSKRLVDEARKSAPPEIRNNFNRIVADSLQVWVELRKREVFLNKINKMSQDPEILGESKKISSDFLRTDFDGLK